jgi:hypothetical protein
MKRNDGPTLLSLEHYLQSLADDLLNNCLQQKIQLTRAWASNFPSAPGVYLFKYKGKIIYVGETGNLRGRMKDMLNTQNHVLRRNIGNKLYTTVEGFQKATSRQSFIVVIEDMLNTHIQTHIMVCCMIVSLGRKELEEKIQKEHSPEYNKKGLRKTS